MGAHGKIAAPTKLPIHDNTHDNTHTLEDGMGGRVPLGVIEGRAVCDEVGGRRETGWLGMGTHVIRRGS